jgi:predicted secreted Zn-dependent protease
VIRITRRLKPDKWSTCERIYADIYKVADYRKHEIEIEWDNKRRLTWADFKAAVPESSSKFSVAATTACEITVESNVLNVFKKPKFFATNKFSCYASWVKPGQINDSLLKHEQCHFDIAEVYRRKLQKQLDETEMNFAEAEKIMKEMTRQIGKAYRNEQAVYDEETAHGLNRDKQKEWELKIAALLN